MVSPYVLVSAQMHLCYKIVSPIIAPSAPPVKHLCAPVKNTRDIFHHVLARVAAVTDKIGIKLLKESVIHAHLCTTQKTLDFGAIFWYNLNIDIYTMIMIKCAAIDERIVRSV